MNTKRHCPLADRCLSEHGAQFAQGPGCPPTRDDSHVRLLPQQTRRNKYRSSGLYGDQSGEYRSLQLHELAVARRLFPLQHKGDAPGELSRETSLNER